ncbi:hypothetical protein [Achromobacter sp. MFA1 R4]|uniref:hypothetical protein n=1 Tax=Achromobacter sp. MFA1 R4 TaxID=1881016 RepID=UPI0009537F07|nr:hypothetical protein [Achromobacter sp. MFA1 R4]SIT32899.1 hypothetical protein SAMN05428937_5547 [Achromobacter sp. MFA1 R4]
MEDKYYVTMALSVDCYEQSDYLHLMTLDGVEIIGYSAEFDTCTTDVAHACDRHNYENTRWFAWDEDWQWRPAKLAEIAAARLDKYLIGAKSDMKTSTEICRF